MQYNSIQSSAPYQSQNCVKRAASPSKFSQQDMDFFAVVALSLFESTKTGIKTVESQARSTIDEANAQNHLADIEHNVKYATLDLNQAYKTQYTDMPFWEEVLTCIEGIASGPGSLSGHAFQIASKVVDSGYMDHIMTCNEEAGALKSNFEDLEGQARQVSQIGVTNLNTDTDMIQITIQEFSDFTDTFKTFAQQFSKI